MGKENKIRLLIVGFLCILTAEAVLVWMEKQHYQDKIQILYQTVGAEENEDVLFQAAEILKGTNNRQAQARGEELLEKYGYIDKGRNVYRQKFYRNCLKITFYLLAVYVLGILGYLYLERKMRNEEKKKEERLRRQLCSLRDGKSVSGEAGALGNELESLSDCLMVMRNQAAAEKEETKTLVTDISHQLKTPVAALKASLEILDSRALTETERREFEGRCKEQMLRLEELMGALVNISRMETGMIQITRQEDAVFETLLLAVSRIYPKALEKQIEIVSEAEDELQKLTLPHDKKWLSEAIINVLENAVKYSPSHTVIAIRMQKMNLFLRIEIEDEGPGIPKEEWNLIFRRFYRGSSERVQSQPGSGVGLYLARQILERHQGTLTVSSKKSLAGNQAGSGSRFVFQLPYQ